MKIKLYFIENDIGPQVISYLKANNKKLDDALGLALQSYNIASYIKKRKNIEQNKVMIDYGIIDDDFINNKTTLKFIFHD